MDPTNKLKNKLAQTLRDIKIQGGLNDHIYRKLYPTSMVAPKFMACPKYTKLQPPSGPIVSSLPSHFSQTLNEAQRQITIKTIVKTWEIKKKDFSLLCNFVRK